MMRLEHCHRVVLAALGFGVGLITPRAETTAPAEAPTEIKMASGAILRGVSVVRFVGVDGVVLKYTGGTFQSRLAYIAEPGRGQLEAYRKVWQAGLDKAANAVRVVRGQVFVTTRGAGAYKFAAARVEAYRTEDFEFLMGMAKRSLPMGFSYGPAYEQEIKWREAWLAAVAKKTVEPVAEVMTDSEGSYQIDLKPGQPVTLVCLTTRWLGGKLGNEWNTWFVPVGGDGAVVDLNNTNIWSPVGSL